MGCASTASPGISPSGLHQLSQASLELAEAHVADLQRQLEVRRDGRGLVGQPRVGHLAEVQDRLVVAEQHRLQVRVAGEAEPAHDGAVEVAHEPVGEEERAGLLVRDLREELLAGEHLVAVRARDPRGLELLEHRLEAAGGAAVAVDDDQAIAARRQRGELGAELGDDARGIEVEHRRQAVDLDLPAAALDDVLHLGTKRAAGDDGRGSLPTLPTVWGGGPWLRSSLGPEGGNTCTHDTGSMTGNASTSTNVSLKSVRPDSSTYSRRDGSSKATCRSR